MRLSRSVKEPAELLCFLWDGEAERGRPSAFLWHACSHGREQRALFSADRSCVRDPPCLHRSSHSPPSIRDEYVSFLVVRVWNMGRWKHKHTTEWSLCTLVHNKHRQTHTKIWLKSYSIQHRPRTRRTAKTISGIINKSIWRKWIYDYRWHFIIQVSFDYN